jgi:hypothetical protein
VPLSAFYAQPESAAYQFTETVDYLREVGALDESVPGAPTVLVANYIAGPSNCIASSTYYSVCCLNECDGLMNEIEGKVRAPSASPERLLSVVGNLSSAPVDTPGIAEVLAEKLNVIAERNGGEVPLHGRLFAQWLHHAFPNECPYPHITENAAVLTPSHWHSKKAAAPKAERAALAKSAPTSATESDMEASELQWSDTEVLLLHEHKQSPGAVRQAARLVVQLAMFCVLIRIAFAAWSSVAVTAGYSHAKKKDSAFSLPLYA